MDQFTDAQLIERIHTAKDEEAFNVLYKRYVHLAYRVANDILKDLSRAEDVVQKIFIRVFERSAQCKSTSANSVRNWMMKMVVNECYDTYKKGQTRAKHETLASERIPVVSSSAEEADLGRSVKEAVSQLPESYRTPIRLHYYEGLNAKAIAEIMLLPLETVRTRMKRGLFRLQKNLAASGLVGAPAMMIDFMGAEPRVMCSDTIVERMFSSIYKGTILNPRDLTLGVSVAKVSSGTLGLTGLPWLKIVSLFSLLVVSAVVGLSQFSKPPLPEKVPLASTQVESFQKDTNIFLDFEQESQLKMFKVDGSEFSYHKRKGVRNSGCISVSENYSIDSYVGQFGLDVKLPLQISMKFNALPGRYLIMGRMGPSSHKVMFHHIDPEPGVLLKKWSTMNIYITEKFTIRMYQGHITSLLLEKISPQAKLYLRALSSSTLYIDNLHIQTVSPESVPDVSLYLRAVESIPVEKRKGRVVLENLKPSPGTEYVFVEFE